MTMHRLFVALQPPPAIRAQLLAAMTGVEHARWQNDDQIHITLRFIGAVDRAVAEDVAIALSAVAAPPLSLRLTGVGHFERRGRPTALWAGISPFDVIAALHRRIDRAVVQAGLSPERRAYRPHVTLARLNTSSGLIGDFLAQHGTLTSADFTIDHFRLFESHLTEDGARYETVARYPLVG